METTTFLDNSSLFVTNFYLSLHCAFGKQYLCSVIRKTFINECHPEEQSDEESR